MVDSIRINAGGGAIGIYSADAYYSGGQSASSNAPVDGKGVYYPANQEVYQTERYGTFTYTFTNLAPNAIHTVKLHFNEHFWDSVGKRKFNAAINGTQVLWDYDIFSQAGGINKAIAEEFVVTSDGRGQIVVNFTPGAADQPSVSGFEINQGTRPHNNMLLGCFPGYANINDIEFWLGKKHAVQVMFTNWDSNSKAQAFTTMQQIWDSGSVPVVTWEVFTNDKNHEDVPANIDALIANGSYDSYLNDWADTMKNFLAGAGGVYGDADDRRVYLRFAHEMNGDWYPWSASYKNSQNTPTDYINMWQHVWTVFKNKGIDRNHLQWLWTPMNTDVGNPLHKAESYWPGDTYVDWVGIDAYNWGTSQSWSNWTPPVALLDDMINRLSGYGKPIAIPEWGTTSDNYGSNNVGAKGQWIVEMFDYLSVKPQIKMLCYFNIDKETDWAIFGGGRGDSTYNTIGSTVHQVYSIYKARVGADYIIPGNNSPQRITDDQFKGLSIPNAVAPAAAGPTTIPYDEIQAENAHHNGTVIDARNNRVYPGLANEAIERRAVTLDAVGKYIEFTVPRSANSIVIRYAIPDSADGTGLTTHIGLYINGEKQLDDLIFTSKYSWVYKNISSDTKAYHFYDEANRLTRQMSTGDKVRLQVEANTTVPCTIDLINFEQVAPAAAMPDGYLSLTTDFGADPSGVQDSRTAFQNALDASSSQNRGLWIPPGEYKISTWLQVRDNVTLKGAGIWYSKIHFVAQTTGNNAGLMGYNAELMKSWNPNAPALAAKNVHFSDFAIWGEVTQRVDDDQLNGIGGAYSNSTFTNLWIEHTKCGMWLVGPFDKLTISNVRIRNQQADGINFHKQVTNSTVTQSFFRNTGDDAIAMWNDQGGGFNTFSFNRVEIPVLANGIAIYGGESNIVTDNYVADQQAEGGGIHVGNRFDGTRPISGRTVIARNVIIRAGSQDYYNNWNFGTGALWFYADKADMTGAILVEDNSFIDSNYEAIHFIGNSVTNVTLNRNQIIGAGTYAMEIRSPGAVTISNTTATGLGHGGILNCLTDFAITDGGGNGSWITQPPVCPDPYPKPIYAPVASS